MAQWTAPEWIMSARMEAVRGVSSLGLAITVLPIASAGATC